MNPNQKEVTKDPRRLIYSLQLKGRFTEEETREIYAALIEYSKKENIQRLAQLLNLILDETDPENFLSSLQQILNYLDRQNQLAPSIPPNLAEWLESLDQREARIEQAYIPTLKEQLRLFQSLVQEELAKTNKELVEKPSLFRTFSRQIAKATMEEIPELAPGQTLETVLPPEAYQAKVAKIINQESKKIGLEPPSEVSIEKIAQATQPQVVTIAALPHPTKAPPRKEVAPVVRPSPADLPFIRWQPIVEKATLPAKTKASIRKWTRMPLAKPLQWLVQLAPEEFRQEHPEIVYVANGITPAVTKKTLNYLQTNKPDSPEIPFWQGLKKTFEEKESPLIRFFEAYHQRKGFGKIAFKLPQAPESFWAKIISFGKVKTFPSLKMAFWRGFKKSGLGRLLSRGAGKLIGRWHLKKAAKVGVKKVVVRKGVAKVTEWLAKKGLSSLVPVIGPILTVLSLAWDLIKFFLGKFRDAFKGFGRFFSQVLPFKIKQTTQRGFDITKDFAFKALSVTIALIFGLSAVSLSISSSHLALLGVGGSVLGTSLMALLNSQLINNAFVVPGPGRPSPWLRQSAYIQVEKTVSFAGEKNISRKIDNTEINETTAFTYQFSVTAKEAKLTNVHGEDVITTTQEAGTNQIQTLSWDIPDLEASETWTSDPYLITTIPVNEFTDSILANSVTATADVEEANLTDESALDSTIVIIGNPPQDCPRGWPVEIQPIVITQGPGGSFSHSQLEAAVDFGNVGNTTPVRATHAGTAHIGYDSIYGRYVSITTTCQEVTFTSLYAHLGAVFVKSGEAITFGQRIGITDDTGRSTGPHLHYEFRSPGNVIKMIQPYTPANIPTGDVCTGSNPCQY